MESWLYATKGQIAKMTFNEAREILEKQIRLGKEGGKYCPRPHTVHAYEMILDRADKYVRIINLLVTKGPNEPTSPILSFPDKGHKLYQCPTCGNPVERKAKNCELCGQNLDWSQYYKRVCNSTGGKGGDEQ